MVNSSNHAPHSTIFGFVPNRKYLPETLQNRTDSSLKIIETGKSGYFFYNTTYGEVGENVNTIALKLGALRAANQTPLTVDTILEQKIITPTGVQPQKISGNGSIICFSKNYPQFCLYQTLLSVSQIHYTRLSGGIICADNFRTIAAFLDQVQINEQAIPMHFMFRLVPGHLTYYDQVYSACPGQQLTWDNETLQINQVYTLNHLKSETYLDRDDIKASRIIFEQLKQTLGATPEAATAPNSIATLLSGGVDSSLIQLALNELRPLAKPLPSFSYAMLTPGYATEVDYAQYACQALETAHTTVEISPDSYLDLLNQTIKTVAHPSLCVETDPCILAVAEHLHQHHRDIRFYLLGHGADALFGLPIARKLLLFNIFRSLPTGKYLSRGLGNLTQPFSPQKAHGLREIGDMLANEHNINSLAHPLNQVAVHTSLPLAQRCFGAKALRNALAYRRQYAQEYLSSQNLMEQVHTINLLTWDYEAAVFGWQLFLEYGHRKLYPFLDQSIIKLAYSFAPSIRYAKNGQVKALLKQILAAKSLGKIAYQSKRGGTFETDLFTWMKAGHLKDRVHSIKRPGFLSQQDFNQLLNHPSPFLWELLILDIFKEQVINTFR